MTENAPLQSESSQDIAFASRKKPVAFPGFFNAFEASTPVRSSSRVEANVHSGKSDNIGRRSFKDNPFDENQILPADDAPPSSSPPSSPIQERVAARAGRRSRTTTEPSEQVETVQSVSPPQNLFQYRDTADLDVSDDEQIEDLQIPSLSTEVWKFTTCL